MKKCSKCQVMKPETDFYYDQSKNDGCSSRCKSCARQVSRDKKPAQRREQHLLHKYCMTPAQYEAKMVEQNGVCAICKQTDPRGFRLAVDHCHDTKIIRGLLCSICNTVIGKMKHDPNLLQAAAQYLRNYESTENR